MIQLTPEGQTVALVAMALATMSTLVRSAVLDKEKLAQQKEKIREHQEKLKSAQKNKDTKGMQKNQEALMEVMGDQMKHSLKPMLYTIIPFILIFGWLRDNFGEIGEVVNIAGHGFGWFAWYFICSIVTSIILNKVLKIN